MKAIDSVPLMISDSDESLTRSFSPLSLQSNQLPAPVHSHGDKIRTNERRNRFRQRHHRKPDHNQSSDLVSGAALNRISGRENLDNSAPSYCPLLTQINLEMNDLPVRIEIRRCSQISKKNFTSTSSSGRHSRTDLCSPSQLSSRGSSGGCHLRVGTPPERRRSQSQTRHSRSQSCRASRKQDQLKTPEQKPRCRSQGDLELPDEQHSYYRLRHFSITGQGIINRGDSFKCRKSPSCVSVASDCTEYSGRSSVGVLSLVCGGDDLSLEDKSAASSCHDVAHKPLCKPYVGLMLGGSGVGKSSLVQQFLTSEYMNTFEIGSIDDDETEKSVSILLNGQESELVFVDPAEDGTSLEQQIARYSPDAFIVVYSVIDSRSLQHAETILQQLWQLSVVGNKAVILVASKTDLVRSRKVSQEAGRDLAKMFNCKFIEVCGGLNHRVDELLVGILSQIRLKESSRLSRSRSLTRYSFKLRRGTAQTSSFKGLLNIVCGKENGVKSCENLQRL